MSLKLSTFYLLALRDELAPAEGFEVLPNTPVMYTPQDARKRAVSYAAQYEADRLVGVVEAYRGRTTIIATYKGQLKGDDDAKT